MENRNNYGRLQVLQKIMVHCVRVESDTNDKEILSMINQMTSIEERHDEIQNNDINIENNNEIDQLAESDSNSGTNNIVSSCLLLKSYYLFLFT